jgi:hypothetical protein
MPVAPKSVAVGVRSARYCEVLLNHPPGVDAVEPRRA